MAELTQVNVRVPEEKKEEWKSHKDAYGSMTRLVETAVDNEIQDEHDTGASDDDSDDVSNQAIAELRESINQLTDTVNDMDKRLKAVQTNVESGPGISVKEAVRQTLPEATQEPQDGLTVTQVAARLNAQEGDVTVALEELIDANDARGLTGGPDNETYYALRGNAQ